MTASKWLKWDRYEWDAKFILSFQLQPELSNFARFFPTSLSCLQLKSKLSNSPFQLHVSQLYKIETFLDREQDSVNQLSRLLIKPYAKDFVKNKLFCRIFLGFFAFFKVHLFLCHGRSPTTIFKILEKSHKESLFISTSLAKVCHALSLPQVSWLSLERL